MIMRDEAHDATPPPVSGEIPRDARQRLEESTKQLLRAESALHRLEARYRRETKQLGAVLSAAWRLRDLPGDRLFDEILRLVATELDHDRGLVLAPRERERYDVAASTGFDKAAVARLRGDGIPRALVDGVANGEAGVAAILAALGLSDGLAGLVPHRADGPLLLVVGRSAELAPFLDPIDDADRRLFTLLLGQIESQLENQALLARVSTEHHKLHQANGALRDKLDELERLRTQLHAADRFAALGSFLGGVFEHVEEPIDKLADRLDVVANGASALVKAFEQLSASHVRRVPTAFAEVTALQTRFDLARWIAAVPEAASHARADAEAVRNLARAARRLAAPGDESARRLDVRGVLDDAIAVAGITIKKRATLETRIEPAPPVRADAPRLAQVVLSLLANAVDALPEGQPDQHVVRLTAQPEEGHVLLAVEDNGEGIDPSLEAKIYEPFFTTRSARGALGLGLTIAKHIVETYKGEISFVSRRGFTRFEVRLPVASTSAPTRKIR
jgi:signal transduction histidine kinase